MKNLAGSVVIITGASAGIGQEFSLQLAAYGAKLVLAARRKDRLEETAKKIRDLGSEALVVPTDLTKVSQISNLVESTMKAYGQIDVLANIAGWGVYKWFEDYSFEEIKNQFDVNVLGLAELTRQVIPIMKKQHSGHIINMSSYASEVAIPPLSVYASTKYAVKGLSDALRRELHSFGIHVSRVHPGSVTGTEFNSLSTKRGGVEYKPANIGRISKAYVAQKLVSLVKEPQPTMYLGNLYAVPTFINLYFPTLVDWGMQWWVKRQRKK